MTALSFWQPYAWLIINGVADVDSRTWAPPEKRIGERIAVHATKRRMTKSDYSEFLKMMSDLKVKHYPSSVDEFD